MCGFKNQSNLLFLWQVISVSGDLRDEAVSCSEGTKHEGDANLCPSPKARLSAAAPPEEARRPEILFWPHFLYLGHELVSRFPRKQR